MTLEPKTTHQIAAVRTQIDNIDEQILKLINQRAQAAQKVAELKRQLCDNADFYRPEREAQVLKRIKDLNPGPLNSETIRWIFREIMSACLALEQPLKVAFLGPAGTFTQAATLKHFGHAIDTASMATIPEVFREVESGACHYGVVPIENSSEGIISHTLDTFIRSNLNICGEVSLRIHQHLLS
ncbi:prephenate dehydratase, partial [Achromatium sp. WMS2]